MKHRIKTQLQPLLKGVPWEALGVRPPRPVVYGVDRRRQDFERGRSKRVIFKVVERVAELRKVATADLLAPAIGKKAEEAARNKPVLEARSMAMAACAAAGAPLCHISRAFGRNWATVYQAERKNAERYRKSEEFRKEWDSVVKGLD